MEPEAIFHYVLRRAAGAMEPEDAKRLAATIRCHVQRHDFAQRVLYDHIRIETLDMGSGNECIVLVPFVREHFQEFCAVNMYIRTRAEEVGLALAGLQMPDGDVIPLTLQMPA